MHHHDAIAHAQHFRHLRRDQNDAQTFGFELVNQLVYLFLCPNIHAACRLIKDQYLRAGHQPAGYRDLLLITAGKQPNGLLHRRRFHVKQADKITHRLLFIFVLETTAAAAEVTQRGQRHVLFNRHAEH